MLAILITPPTNVPGEAATLASLVHARRPAPARPPTAIHVRKPGWDRAALAAYVRGLDPAVRALVVLHSHHDLVGEFGLKVRRQQETRAPSGGERERREGGKEEEGEGKFFSRRCCATTPPLLSASSSLSTPLYKFFFSFRSFPHTTLVCRFQPSSALIPPLCFFSILSCLALLFPFTVFLIILRGICERERERGWGKNKELASTNKNNNDAFFFLFSYSCVREREREWEIEIQKTK